MPNDAYRENPPAQPHHPRPALMHFTVLPPGPGERRRVLVVDDEPGMRYMARRILEKRYEVSEAHSGEEALRLLECEAFHIAIVDVRLPGLSGLDLLSALKTCCPSIDVIVMTGSAVDIDEALEGAIRRKAFFFLRKPFPMTVLETLVERIVETQVLEEKLVDYAWTLERNLESARIFQRRILPPSSWKGERIRIASRYQASERLSGDFLDYWSLPDGGTALLVVDVMGHGPSAAMVTGIVKSQVHSLAMEIHQPGEVLSALEEELSRIALPSFMTALLVFDHPPEGMITYCGAGHPPALLIAPGEEGREDTPRFLVSEGIPINTGLPLRERRTQSMPRPDGLRMLLYTDGYPEAQGASGLTFDAGSEPASAPGTPAGPVRPAGPAAGAPPIDLLPPEFFPDGSDSPFARAALDALRAASPEDGISALDAALTAFVAGTNPDDDRAAILAWLL
jgi:phosphoserine phosphatase RsbU/P